VSQERTCYVGCVAPDALIEFETETPELGPRDLLVNPVDVNVRANMGPDKGNLHESRKSFTLLSDQSRRRFISHTKAQRAQRNKKIHGQI